MKETEKKLRSIVEQAIELFAEIEAAKDGEYRDAVIKASRKGSYAVDRFESK